MVRLPAGTFTMGVTRGDPSEQPGHKVTLARSFALGMYEVTVAEWRACVQGGGCTDMPRMAASVTDGTPVHNVHWNDAVAYATWLSKRTGTEIPPADRSGVGIRRARRHGGALLVGRNRRRRQCQLRELRRFL